MPQHENSVRRSRLRRICRLMVLLCLLVAGGRLATGLAPGFDPALAAAQVQCSFEGCRLARDPARLLPDTMSNGRPISSIERAQVAEVLSKPRTHVLIFAGSLVRALPAFLLFLTLALAFQVLARGAGFTEAAAWLRRAALAAAVAVVAEPVGATLRATALSEITTGKEQIHFLFSGGPFLWGVILAGAAWVAVWAMEEASATERELAEIV